MKSVHCYGRKSNADFPPAVCRRVAVRLIRDREIEIENFKPDEYWNIDALLHPQGEKGEFTARLAATADGKKLTVTDKQQADAVLAALDGKDYTITKNRKRASAAVSPRRPSSPRLCSRTRAARSAFRPRGRCAPPRPCTRALTLRGTARWV